jgi:hypothetical protein
MRGMDNFKRNDVANKIDQDKERMDRERADMGVSADDHEISIETLGKLELQVASEDGAGVTEHLHEATNAADEDFEKHNEELEDAHESSVEFNEELDSRAISGESDIEQANRANDSAKLIEVRSRIDGALKVLREGVDFLKTEAGRNTDIRTEIKRDQTELKARIAKKG